MGIIKLWSFDVNYRTEFGGFPKETRKAIFKNDVEEFFKEILNCLPKRILKTWESIEFTFNNNRYEIRKDWLEETNYDFQKSHQKFNLLEEEYEN